MLISRVEFENLVECLDELRREPSAIIHDQLCPAEWDSRSGSCCAMVCKAGHMALAVILTNSPAKSSGGHN
jgi:hypothetical protein